MRRLAIGFAAFVVAVASASAGLAAPPAAPNDTIAAILAHGDVISASGKTFVFTYKPDGTFDASGLPGTYTVDGAKFCVTIDGLVDNDCAEYPAGKKSGDTFSVQGDIGPYTVSIH
jgi:hypothetical protein